jgi:hypothetical protein
MQSLPSFKATEATLFASSSKWVPKTGGHERGYVTENMDGVCARQDDG